MVDVKQVADAADMIVNGYAFTRCAKSTKTSHSVCAICPART